MSVPWQSARHGRGLLLLRGEPNNVARWVSRGLVACHVVPLQGWTGVVPAEPASRAEAPYDDAVTLLAARPVNHRNRAALGFFAFDGRAVVTVQPGGWRAVHRWLVWEPGRGPVRTPRLDVARPADLVTVAGAGQRVRAREVADLLGDPRGDAATLLADVMGVLGLPGVGLLTGEDDPDGRLVEPAGSAVARFDALMHEDARHRAESEE